MRITNKKFNKVVSETIERNKEEYKWKYCAETEDVTFHNIEIRKNKNSDSYNIVVSIDEIDNIPMSLIKDLIEETCNELNIEPNKILVEL